jgi:hypothetical protein
VPSGNRDHVAGAQRIGHLVHDAQRVALALALDEERAGARHQPADQRPVRTSALETKRACGARGMDARDVDPRRRGWRQQRAPPRAAAVHREPDAEPRSSAADHHWMRRWRPAASSVGKRSAITAMPCSRCTTSAPGGRRRRRRGSSRAGRAARTRSLTRRALVGDAAGHQRGVDRAR